MKIGIVNDVPLAVEALRRVVTSKPEHTVVWIAQNGAEAVELCAKTTPDLVLMDLLMPVMDGVEATRRIMAGSPCAILVVTASVVTNTSRVFEAMGHGALDAVNTPALHPGDPLKGGSSLLNKIDSIGKLIAGKKRASTVAFNASASPFVCPTLVAIGASAGGPAALVTLLRELPADLPAAVVIIQHVDEQFAAGMAEWLNQSSKLPVRIASAGDRPTAGSVLLAGTNDHLILAANQRLIYSANPVDYVYRPSVDVFFQSASRFWSGDIIGVLLTGMGRDGALGLKHLRTKGYHTIAQDKATSAVYGMPKAAAALDAAVDILPLEQIAPRLTSAVRSRIDRQRCKDTTTGNAP